jgi:hypothetical protein
MPPPCGPKVSASSDYRARPLAEAPRHCVNKRPAHALMIKAYHAVINTYHPSTGTIWVSFRVTRKSHHVKTLIPEGFSVEVRVLSRAFLIFSLRINNLERSNQDAKLSVPCR